jgi:flagellar biosynthesis anti-sigma factor FlgM
MDNKINGLQRIAVTPELTATARVAVRSRGAEAGAAVAPDDQVSLTDSAQALRQTESDLESPPVDSQRVAYLRKAIADGAYHVDVERIAAKLIELEHAGGLA